MSKRESGASASALGWLVPWVQVCEMAWVGPQVIAYRTVRLVSGGWPPTARAWLEYNRMVTEKVNAFGQVGRVVLTTSPGTGLAAVSAAIEPLHRVVLANRRRLSRG
jgi:hypothetical protein